MGALCVLPCVCLSCARGFSPPNWLLACYLIIPTPPTTTTHAPGDHWQYTIYHGLSDSATVATLNDATDDSVILYLPSALAPLRGNVALPRTAHIKLYEGNVYLNIATAANPVSRCLRVETRTGL